MNDTIGTVFILLRASAAVHIHRHSSTSQGGKCAQREGAIMLGGGVGVTGEQVSAVHAHFSKTDHV